MSTRVFNRINFFFYEIQKIITLNQPDFELTHHAIMLVQFFILVILILFLNSLSKRNNELHHY
jgi:hypothetical protein